MKIFILDVALLLFLGLIFLGQFPSAKKPKPKTLEDRVNAILSATPLIGTYTHVLLSKFF